MRKLWLALLLLAPGALYVLLDQAVWPVDPSWYGATSIDLWSTLVGDPSAWPRHMLSAFAIKPPGIAWIGQFFVPLHSVFGSVERALLLSTLLLQFGTLLLMHRIGGLLSGEDRLLAAVGMLFVAAAPMFATASHVYYVEPLQLFAVTYGYWIALQCPRLSVGQILAHVCWWAALSMLAKITSPAYCLLPAALVAHEVWQRRRQVCGLPWHGVAGGMALLCTMAWYARNLLEAWQFSRYSYASNWAAMFGGHAGWWYKMGFWAVSESLNLGPFLPLLAIAALLSVRAHGQWARRDVVAMAALGEIAALYAIFCFSDNEKPRFLLPLVSACGIVLVWVLSRLPSRRPAFVVAGLLTVQFVLVHLDNFGALDLWASPNLYPYTRKFYDHCQTDATAKREMERLTEVTTAAPSLIMCVSWTNEVQHRIMDFYGAKASLRGRDRCRYACILGPFSEQSPMVLRLGSESRAALVDESWRRMQQLRPQYFVYAEAHFSEMSEEEAARRVRRRIDKIADGLYERMQSDSEYEKVPFESALGIQVYRLVDKVSVQ